MILPSRLGAKTLGDVLGQCHRGRATGALLLSEPQGRCHRIFLSRGLVTAVVLERASPSLSELLVEEAQLDPAILRRSLLRSLSSTRLHGEVLVQDFALSPSLVSLALRRQIRQRLTVLEGLREISVRFSVTEPVPRHALGDEPLPPAEFLVGRRRGRDAAASSAPPKPRDQARQAAQELLGLRTDSDERAVKRAYRQLVRALHPDLNPGADATRRAELQARFARVTEAYQLLVG